MKKITSSSTLLDLFLPHSFVKSSTYDCSVNWLSEIVDEHPLCLLKSQWFLCVRWMYHGRKITDTPPQRLDNIFSIHMNMTDLWYLISWKRLFQAIMVFLKLKEASPRSGLLMKTEAVFTQCWTNINKMLLNCSTISDYAVIFQAIRTGKNTFYYWTTRQSKPLAIGFFCLLLHVLLNYRNWSAAEKILASLPKCPPSNLSTAFNQSVVPI